MAEETDTPAHTFETAMARLSAIVRDMEDDILPLEDLIVRYEEGTKLVQVCSERLAAAEQKIAIITRRAGKASVEEFEPKAGAPTSAGKVSLF